MSNEVSGRYREQDALVLPGSLVLVRLARIKLLVAVVFYVCALIYGHDRYLSLVQGFWGFNSPSFNLGSMLLIIVLAVVPVFVMPLYLTRPSTLFIYALVFCVYLPAIVIGMLNHEDSLDRYFWLFFCFCIGLVGCCLAVRCVPLRSNASRSLSRPLVLACVLGSLTSFLVLFLTYRDILSFSGADDIYAQREKGAATSLFIGYCQVYLAYFLSPVLFATGLVSRRVLIALLGFAGFIFVFMITAERTVFLMPFAMFLLAFIFKRRGGNPNNPAYLFAGGGMMIFLIAALYDQVGIFRELGFYFYTRLIAYPGLFVTQYYDLFAAQGFTYWAHVSGIGRLVDVPAAFATDEKWPLLGKILAERVLGVQSQSNASFVATDGVAAAGAPGILVIFVLYTAWLIALDWVSQGWNKVLLLTALFPLAFVTTNGPFFTMLASFGGGLWIAMLWADKFRIKLWGYRL
ncbi:MULTISPECIES: hypothetical protein [Pseudomonas]|uniref:hypothetical protein n=1 Tax=Pseudomonas TaxID=286 RepID=UPI000CF543D6|nr:MULTISPECIES: hypothetical protein [Pseudomonas]QNV66587.1 hypothetical protein F7661_12015 [Pseudomonas sp. CFA]MCX2816091.1 hypothetical protein [Pseudomonas sp. DCB_E]MCX9142823.1 hypothetical protein [Pseudomonas sp. DCB_Q]MDD2004278.1 hypothetical protein [Pseudomonas putida]MDH0707698.1 hypothetical protein [Pseudomonas sp. GD03862]